jgi:hypothetical protein
MSKSATTAQKPMQAPSQKPIRFSAQLLTPRKTDSKRLSWWFIMLPSAASKQLRSRSMVSVKGTINDHPILTTLQPDGKGGHWLKIENKTRRAAKLESGDEVSLCLKQLEACEEPEPKVPPDLRKALTQAQPKAREIWADITPVARRDWIHWITSAKQAQTRERRIQTACDMLAKGKRRACCFDRSGMFAKNMECPVAETNP